MQDNDSYVITLNQFLLVFSFAEIGYYLYVIFVLCRESSIQL
jgi:hypothetical protein